MAPPASRRAGSAAAWGFFLLGKTSLPGRSGNGSSGWAASLRTPILDPDPGLLEVAASRPSPEAVADPGQHARGCPERRRRHRRVAACRSSDLFGSALPSCGIRAGSLGADWAAPTSRKRRRSALPSVGCLRAFPCSGIHLLLLSAALGLVAAMETFTSGTLEALNGTDVRLKCTFRSPVPVGPKLTVSWSFQSELKESLETVLYYNHWAYPSKSGRFLGRITWDGNVHKDDASVMLHNVSPKDNGTFQCHVKNPPDVDGVIGEIQLSVVLKRNFSEVHILILTIGISCVVMVILVVVMVIWRHWRRMHQDKTREVGRSEQLKLKESGEEKDTPLPGQGTRRS
ncbi:myelin protein zero-like protein 2 [Ahaetulla prasina]|uniref:myelin protein zero-like protein 2 n=1 Tax=Ahaetulla prasina TaxID=499056 RepID=UPI0026479EC9|nr:myelin protein zero-like protein 2 [Ahaetulla prasina]